MAPGRTPTVTALAVVVAVFGVLALLAPLGHAEHPVTRAGTLLALGGAIEILHGIRRADSRALRRAVTSGVISLAMGVLVFSAPYLAGQALVVLLSVTFLADGVSSLVAARRAQGRHRRLAVLSAAGDLAAAAGLVVLTQVSETWLVAVAAALRLFGIAWNIAVTPAHTAADATQTVIDDLGLEDRPEAADLIAEIAAEEKMRTSADRGRVVAFVVTLFAIHVARLEPDGTLLGYLSPLVAVLGDMALAVLFAFLVAAPVALSLRSSTMWLERITWRWYLGGGDRSRPRYRVAAAWLRYRLRMALRLREARYSIPAALGRSLAAGLPMAAVVAATVPVWGMSWFFDTENWASGVWNSWAEARTDKWREEMARAVTGPAGAQPGTFAVTPPGTESGDFSFIVIGDTGEGDASQNILRDQLLAAAARPEVRFVVISSDVVYPDGSMIDYEACFWLPFKGVTKPVYAIPGNHDWYDALEAFLATFLEPDAARTAMRARVDADLRLTSTTSARIDGLIAQAARLRDEYEVPTGFQRGPFFELQTEHFALVAIDTGVVKRIDDEQWRWLESALARARGKFVMAILGHPFYAKAYDMTYGNEPFARIKRLLLDHGVAVMMAGDTHDLEYYAEPPGAGPEAAATHYFVNGGGGAYLSMGSALEWPADPPVAQWAIYPSREAIVRKVDLLTPGWKRPAWWWTDRHHAWPFSAEYLSALFDYNVAPFFQSFVEVRVEPSARRVRLLPYGVHGRLRWREITRSPVLSAATRDDDLVEWIVPMR